MLSLSLCKNRRRNLFVFAMPDEGDGAKAVVKLPEERNIHVPQRSSNSSKAN